MVVENIMKVGTPMRCSIWCAIHSQNCTDASLLASELTWDINELVIIAVVNIDRSSLHLCDSWTEFVIYCHVQESAFMQRETFQ